MRKKYRYLISTIGMGKASIALLVGMVLIASTTLYAQSIPESLAEARVQKLGLEAPASEFLSQKVTLKYYQVSIEKLLRYLEQEQEIQFAYSRELLADNPKVTLRLENVTLEQALKEIFKGTSIRYFAFKGNYIVLKEEYKFKFVQEEVTGIVTDASTGESLPGVNIAVKGTTTGTSTDQDGAFELNVPSLQDTLVFSFIGYQTQEVALEGRTTVDISLQPQAIAGDELVVIGYGSVQKSDLTGSISSVRADELTTGVQASVDQMLQSRAPGVKITQTSSEPGGGVSVRIRGATSLTAGNDPLYVIDGQPINNVSPTPSSPISNNQTPRNPLKTLNPSDIASVEILKDASATAIYGSRGANGVILITTKKGEVGQLQVEYNGSTSTQQVAQKLDFFNATEYMNHLNGLREDEGQAPLFTQQEISAAGEGTNWQDEIFRAAPLQNHQLSLSGGTESTQYYASLNYFNQKGVIIDSGTERYSGRLNLDHSAGRFNFGMKLSTTFSEDDYVANGVGINNNGGVVATAHQMDPLMSVRDAEGNFSQSTNLDLNNPVAIAHTWSDFAETNRTMGNIFGEYDIVDNLSVKVQIGTDRQTSRRDGFISNETRRGQQTNGEATINDNERSNYVLETTINYANQFNQDHSLNAVAGYTYQVFNGRGVFANTSDFVTQNFLANNLSAGNSEQHQVNSNKFKHQLLSYLGRVNYSFSNRYLITASFRIDGSSRFGEDNKYGYFPSLALGWRLSEEQFISDLNIFSNLKLRTSYGVTGNQEIGNYNSLVLLGTTGGGFYDSDAILGNNVYTGIKPTQLGNPDLKWETTEQYNVGLDLGFFEDRITGSMDYFVKKTSDLLLQLPIPSTSGFSSSLQNVGNTRNSGFEFMINSRNLVDSFTWSTTFNIATLQNEVTNLGELPFILQGGLRFQDDLTILREGDPINAYYGYKTDGIFQSQQEIDGSAQPTASPGDIKFRDVNQDGQINPDDRTILGQPFPEVSFGLNNEFSYKGFGLAMFIEGNYGYELLNFSRLDSEYPISFRRNRQAYTLNRWTPENPTSENPSYVNMDVSKAINSRVLEDASYIRLKNLNLSYGFPNLNIGGINSLSIYLSAQNLVTFTDYSGYNPDVSSLGDSNIRVDYNAYPLARIYTLGININI